ncbi:MAG TPA: hypothetical protein VF509_00540 [Sphingobium sp.]
MMIGLVIDIWRSPIGAIPVFCSPGGDILTRLLFHFTLMPVAHLGMLTGAMMCVIWNLGHRTVTVMPLIRIALWQLGVMAAAEIGPLMLFARLADPIPMMLIMAVVMLALGAVPNKVARGCCP